MYDFLGEYEVTVDAKGRFLLPTQLRKSFPEGEPFVVNRSQEKCLNLYPKKRWDYIVEKIKKLDDLDETVRQFKTFFFGGATRLELDSAGRLLIPASLKRFANIEKDITISPDTDKVKIWNTEVYNEIFDKGALDYKSVSQQVSEKYNLRFDD